MLHLNAEMRENVNVIVVIITITLGVEETSHALWNVDCPDHFNNCIDLFKSLHFILC